MTERAYFAVCLALGRVLRSTRYSNVRIVYQDGESKVRKHRLFYAPFLLWMTGPLTKVLDARVRVLRQRDWEKRERELYQTLYGISIRLDGAGTLVLPRLPGETLARLLENPELEESVRKEAIELAVFALARFHATGFTHGDASAENVVVDLDARVAHWIDFEIVHDSSRSLAWRRADDVRALLSTCAIRTAREKLAQTVDIILDVYSDREVTELMTTHFASAWQRPLAFHLGQAGLPFAYFREIGRLLREHSH